MSGKLSVVVKDEVATVTMKNIEKKNALDNDVISSLVLELPKLDRDDGVKVILLRGEGKMFSAGGDIKAMASKTDMFSGDGVELQKNYEWGIQEIPRVIERLSTPIIAVIDGGAVGAGVDLACMCDLRVGSADCFFAETFSLLALVPGDGGTFFLPRVVGYARAMEMFLTGDKYSSEHAYRMGLLNYLVRTHELEDFVEKLCGKIKNSSHQAVRLMKKSLKASWKNRDLETSLDQLSAFQGITQNSIDHEQRLNKLLGK